MKKTCSLILTLAFVLLSLAGCGQVKTMPADHSIEADKSMPTTTDEWGADAYGRSLDNVNSKYYVIHDFYNAKSGDGLSIIPEFETYQQTTEYTCGTACALMVLNHYGVTDYNEMVLAEMAKTDTEKGTSVEGLASLFEQLGFTVEAHGATEPHFESIEAFEAYLVDKIDRGIPVMVDWVDWCGHWQVVIGFDTCGTESPDDDVLIVADPYDVTDHCQDGYYTYPLSRFYYMWREGICAQKEVDYEQPFVTVYPKG